MAEPPRPGRYVATPPFVERVWNEPDEDALLAAMRIAAGFPPRVARKRKET